MTTKILAKAVGKTEVKEGELYIFYYKDVV